MKRCKTLYSALVISTLLATMYSCSADNDETVYSAEVGQIVSATANIYTGQRLSLSAQLPECIVKRKAELESASWVAVYGDSVVRKAGLVSDGYCFLNDTMPDRAMNCTYTLTLKFNYKGSQQKSVNYVVNLRQSDALNSAWGETPEETMRNVPVALNSYSGRYEYYEETQYGVRNRNSLWSYYYINNKLFSITHLERFFNESDSLCFARFLNMYRLMKQTYGAPIKSDDATLVENIIASEGNDSLYNYCMDYYGKCLHRGRIATSDSTEAKYSLNIKFVKRQTLVNLDALCDSVNAAEGGMYYCTEYSYRLQ